MKTQSIPSTTLRKLREDTAAGQASELRASMIQSAMALGDEPTASEPKADDGYVFNINHCFLVSRRKHARWGAELADQFPWLPPNSHINIAPGHMAVVEDYLNKIGKLLGSKRLEFLSIESSIHRPPVPYVDVADKMGEGQHRALQSAREIFTSRVTCALCGDDLDSDALIQQPVCAAHKPHVKHGILYAEDITPELSQLIDREAEEPKAAVEAGTPADFDDEWGDPDDGPYSSSEDEPPVPYVTMYDPAELERIEKSAGSRDRETKSRVLGLVRQIKDVGPVRQLATVPENWQSRLDELNAEFPNFETYIDSIRCQLALASVGDGVIHLLPVILNGPPGIGKSEILARLADLLGLPHPLKIDFATAQNSSALTGSDAHWANSSEGQLFRTLMLGTVANPVVLIDEIDKSLNEGRNNPTAALYGLLEKTTARSFEDLSMRCLKIDASHVQWVASANDVEMLEAPIRSRFSVIDVPRPTAAQARSIQCGIWRAMIAAGELGTWFDPDKPLSASTLDALSGLSPREAKLTLRMSAGKAVASGRKEIWPCDLRLIGISHSSSGHYEGGRVGFHVNLGVAA